MKVFLDTNVLVAAFATRGLCEDILRTVLSEHDLVTSGQVLQELERALFEKLHLPRAKAKAVCEFVRNQAAVVEPKAPAAWPHRDPDDRWIVAAAIEAVVDVIVTGDRDLLDVADDVPVSIISPRGFWEALR